MAKKNGEFEEKEQSVGLMFGKGLIVFIVCLIVAFGIFVAIKMLG